MYIGLCWVRTCVRACINGNERDHVCMRGVCVHVWLKGRKRKGMGSVGSTTIFLGGVGVRCMDSFFNISGYNCRACWH